MNFIFININFEDLFYPATLKKGIGIFLFLCLTMPFFVSYHWLAYHRDQVRREIKQKITGKLDSTDLVILRFTVKESRTCLRWIEHGEFEYRNRMYDVIRSEIRGDQVIYLCYPDHQETALNQKVSELVSTALGQHQQNRDHQKRFFKFVQSLYITNHSGWIPPEDQGSQAVFMVISHLWMSLTCEPPEPPPRFTKDLLRHLMV